MGTPHPREEERKQARDAPANGTHCHAPEYPGPVVISERPELTEGLYIYRSLSGLWLLPKTSNESEGSLLGGTHSL